MTTSSTTRSPEDTLRKYSAGMTRTVVTLDRAGDAVKKDISRNGCQSASGHAGH